MAKKFIITIARQYGSGGREIGERLRQSSVFRSMIRSL